MGAGLIGSFNVTNLMFRHRQASASCLKNFSDDLHKPGMNIVTDEIKAPVTPKPSEHNKKMLRFTATVRFMNL